MRGVAVTHEHIVLKSISIAGHFPSIFDARLKVENPILVAILPKVGLGSSTACAYASGQCVAAVHFGPTACGAMVNLDVEWRRWTECLKGEDRATEMLKIEQAGNLMPSPIFVFKNRN